ncbi:hypothetical protein LOZ52_004493 [Ophidiomyces ophidiicola]|nr:hypothetical protein LOZ64_002349 [Ophidiomyces ophidiicola]KAI2007348.1 hypothetical protein LOZ50_002638 [Ophidiomyces ophidiicola]KAI2018920.1 hypothetical protein LOZ46_003620 [Ophidiomyces ophidiicola]KAI2138980.1 hypothetical protein LOZ29_002659 [Ophidiomyces ophidiicola]KAI2141329.1 hypothetical protein LOZ28_002598 [Ophidiomyces ophidiicola]
MPTSKRRVKVACQLCHARRVKCDRTEETACSNCQLTGQECLAIVSRRGKYKRRRNGSSDLFPDLVSLSQIEGGVIQSIGTIAQQEDVEAHPISDSTLTQTSPMADSGSNEGAFYGDSFNLKYVFHEICDPLNKAPESLSLEESFGRLHFEHLDETSKARVNERRMQDMARLKSEGVFQMPPKNVADELVQLFFRSSYPLSALLFDQAEFYLKYECGRISPLILHAIHFASLVHCEDETYKAAGYSSRFEASSAFYHRAKALYDANYESDAITNLQAVCLLSQWWGTPTEQKYTWHWVGIAVSLAQSLELHRLRAYTNLPTKEIKFRRKIWWGIYTADILEALILGQTPHINDAYCDVPPLNESDFDCNDENGINVDENRNHTTESKLYLVQLANLATKTSKCLLATFGNGADESTIEESLEIFCSWETSLPKELQYTSSMVSLENGFWTALLHLNFQCVNLDFNSNNPLTQTHSQAIAKYFYVEMGLVFLAGCRWEPYHLMQLLRSLES